MVIVPLASMPSGLLLEEYPPHPPPEDLPLHIT